MIRDGEAGKCLQQLLIQRGIDTYMLYRQTTPSEATFSLFLREGSTPRCKCEPSFAVGKKILTLALRMNIVFFDCLHQLHLGSFLGWYSFALLPFTRLPPLLTFPASCSFSGQDRIHALHLLEGLHPESALVLPDSSFLIDPNVLSFKRSQWFGRGLGQAETCQRRVFIGR